MVYKDEKNIEKRKSSSKMNQMFYIVLSLCFCLIIDGIPVSDILCTFKQKNDSLKLFLGWK